MEWKKCKTINHYLKKANSIETINGKRLKKKRLGVDRSGPHVYP
jgi:hypothetical protein